MGFYPVVPLTANQLDCNRRMYTAALSITRILGALEDVGQSPVLWYSTHRIGSLFHSFPTERMNVITGQRMLVLRYQWKLSRYRVRAVILQA